jgi:hypothetical protein
MTPSSVTSEIASGVGSIMTAKTDATKFNKFDKLSEIMITTTNQTT